MSFSDLEPDYSSLPGNDKMLWRLREAAEIIAFTGGSVVSPGDEPLGIPTKASVEKTATTDVKAPSEPADRKTLSVSEKVGTENVEPTGRLLAEADWVRIRNRALVHARWLELANRWSLPKNTAEDLVHEAIRKVLDGTRRWDPKRIPDLDYFVVSVVRSEYVNLARRLRSKPQSAVGEGDGLSVHWLQSSEEAFELKRMVEGALYELQMQKPELYKAFVEFERLGLFDGRSEELIASELGISQRELSRQRREMVDITDQYLSEIRHPKASDSN